MEKKIVVVGPGGVGKSALTIQLVQGTFTSQYDPTIEDTYRKQIEVDHNHLVLDILDTAGQEEYSSMRASYMRTGEGFFCVFSLISEVSVGELKEMHNTILRAKGKDTVPMVLVGNKVDLVRDRQVDESVGQELSALWECAYFETSAKNNLNVEESFKELARAILRSQPRAEPDSMNTKSSGKGKKGPSCLLL